MRTWLQQVWTRLQQVWTFPAPTRARHAHGVRNCLEGELNSPAVERLNRGLMANSRICHFCGIQTYYLAGESNSPVVEWLIKGVMSASSPTRRPPPTCTNRNKAVQKLDRSARPM
eukprot:1247-Prorocentrum_minimum.AAC.1